MLRRMHRLFGRRERVVPVVLRAQRRRWERAGPPDWASQLHLLYLAHRDRYQPAYFVRSGSYPMPRGRLPRAWRWFVLDVVVQVVKLVSRNGSSVRSAAGVPVWRQLRDLLWLSVLVPSMPEKYYMFEWYRPENRARANAYLHRHETKGGLYAMLAEAENLELVTPLNDKVAFAAHADAAGLAVVPTVAVIEDGKAIGEVVSADMFVKHRAGKGGRGAQRWAYDAGGYHRDGHRVPQARFLAWLADQSDGQPLLVQPCLANHPDLADLALDALATCRIVTILDEAGVPEPVIAIFRMPAVRGSIVDNMHRGGIAAPVAIDSGELGAASGYAVAGLAERHTHHPVTGAAIAGRKLPAWDSVRNLAVAAHQAFRPRILVGWDISIGSAGPVLVEGNEQPGVDGLQRLHDRPLGSHRFGQLLAFQLIRRFGPTAAVTE